MNPVLKDYLRKDIHSVEGYITVLDSSLFAELLSAQSERGILGSLVEIGVHCGKSFFLLSHSRAAGEKAFAVDLYEDDALFQGEGGIDRGQRFHRNVERLGVQLTPEEIWKGSSHDISGEDMSQRAGPVRFFSIDGGHAYADVINDLDIAAGSLHDQGVIAADDFSNFLWPEVAAAACDWLRVHPGFRAFAISSVKLYICRTPAYPLYREIAQAAAQRMNSAIGDVHLFDSVAVGLQSPLRVRMASAVRNRLYRIKGR